MNWISVKDQLPGGSGYCLTFYRKSIKTSYWNGKHFLTTNTVASEKYIRKTVTHWMTLPEPPKAERDKPGTEQENTE